MIASQPLNSPRAAANSRSSANLRRGTGKANAYMQKLMRSRKQRRAGFSLIELLVVLAIIMIISAMALPNIITAIRTARLRSAGSEIGGFIEQVRMTAVRENRTMYIRNTVVNGVVTWYGDRPVAGVYNDTLDVGEPRVGMNSTLLIANAGFPAATNAMKASNPGGAGSTFSRLATMTDGTPGAPELGFNTRGLPCQVVPAGGCNRLNAGGLPTNMIVYLQNNNNGYVTVTMSANGKLRVWMWDGAAYQ